MLDVQGRAVCFVSELGGIPKPLRRLTRGAAAFTGVGGALDYIEKQIIRTSRGICGLRRVIGFMLQPKPALGIDLNFALPCMTSKMKVQTHCETQTVQRTRPILSMGQYPKTALP